jgi:diguanylate cyclase (GGDEF)-like protein
VRQLGKMFIQMSEQISHSLNNLKNQADRDALTGLPNRVAMEKELQKRIDKEEMYSVLFLDLDGFKPINDNLGHEIGDVVLQSVGQKLMETFRNKDYVCRWGGDEFVVCLYGDVESVIPKLITRIRGKLAEINVNAMAGREDLPPYRVGASIGISTYPSDGVSVETLIQIADEKMYEDKVSRKVGR